MKVGRKFAKNCSIQGKNREISVPYNFWTPVKINISDVWNWNGSVLFGSGIEVWVHGPPVPSPPPTIGYTPASFSCSGFHPLQIITDVSEADLSNLAVPPSFYRFLQVSQFVEFFSRYSLLSLLNQSLIRKLFYSLYKKYSFDLLEGCARSRPNDSRFMHKLSLSLHAMNILGLEEQVSSHQKLQFELGWIRFF